MKAASSTPKAICTTGGPRPTPPTVNAYYDPQMNDINFPAGVLQPPLYDSKMDDAPNYGNTGGTIGHELTHGFDDEGRQFDATGNLHDWWTKQDAEEFEKRAKCVSDQYSGYTVMDDIKINGKLTLGEDVADLVKKPDRRKRIIPFGLMMAVGLIALLAANWLELM